MQEDPLFFDAQAGQYALWAGSACIDAGSPEIPNSYSGLSRAQVDEPDIGAYEMALPIYLPLVLRDSG